METLSSQSFREKVYDFSSSSQWQFKGSRPAILDFYADWCGPCRTFTPIFEEVARTYQGVIDFYKIDCQLTPELTAVFGIRGIPSIAILPVGGEPVVRSGVVSRESLEEMIKTVFGIEKPSVV